MQIEREMCLATKDRINPCWGRSLLLHSSVIAAVVMIIYLVAGIGAGLPVEFFFFAIIVSLLMPVLYPLFGPYLVAFGVLENFGFGHWWRWPLVMVSYGVYLALLLGGLLPRDKRIRVVCDVALVVWFLLTLWGIARWSAFWGV